MPNRAIRRTHEQDVVAEMVQGHLEHHEPEGELRSRMPHLTCSQAWSSAHNSSHVCHLVAGHNLLVPRGELPGTEHECWCGASVNVDTHV